MCRGGSVVPDIGAIALLHPLPVPVGLQQQGGVGPGENTAGRHDIDDMDLEGSVQFIHAPECTVVHTQCSTCTYTVKYRVNIQYRTFSTSLLHRLQTQTFHR